MTKGAKVALLHFAASTLVACGGGGDDGAGAGGSVSSIGGADAASGGAAAGGAESVSGGASSGGADPATGGAGVGGDPLGSGGDVGAGGMASGGMDGSGGAAVDTPPDSLLETGLFTSRGTDGELVLADGVREFQPKYWLWSDGADKKRYVYLPPGTQIDTSNPDHWSFPAGTKFWKSFISEGQLVETRLIERTGDGPSDFLMATYFWQTSDATDAMRMDYKNLLLNAAGTTHDIPNGQMCERCHNTLEERIAGFGAIQLNHDLGGITLQTLLDEDLLTVAISTDINLPGDQVTQDALGYLHANCGNCHNDNPGLPIESVPEPQMLLRARVSHTTFEETDVYNTAVNQMATASNEIGLTYRIEGSSTAESVLHFRMTQRLSEYQMPPIGTEETDPDGLATIEAWVNSLPAPIP